LRRLTRLGALAVALACQDTSYRQIGAAVDVVRRDALLVPADREALARFGRQALPQIETALHTAPLRGRLNLIAVLESIGDAESIPVLRHFAVYDPSAEMQEACEAVLRAWAAASDPRGTGAAEALKSVAAKRARGEGPPPAR
jgi:hypothetical protein